MGPSYFTGSRVLKHKDVIATAAARKTLAPFSKKSKIATQNTLSKWPCLDTETAGEAPRPTKRIKKLTKKKAREIHVISSQTTRTAPSASPPAPVVQASTEKRPTPTSPTPQVHSAPEVSEVVVKPVVVLLVEKPAALGPTVAPVLKEATPSVGKNLPKNPKQSAIILEEDDKSDEISLASHPRPTEPSSVEPPPMVEVTDQVNPPVADREKMPQIEPEAAETLIHPQVQDLDIPPQEVTSVFVRLDHFFLLTLL
ncbi:predicted GPI-anchored protein 58 [Malus sylvestris]|uniref:predicted GPI-anchored protein 58 n=1 Tax=Malus sylvestris TaxID=3752 RepID=UPI0021ACD965|nr:predicted GPI-anchored protein 58 [Malus sylvestris]